MKLIVGNFKMNLLKEDINNYLKEIGKYNFSNVIYCPSNIYLMEFVKNNLIVGCQDISSYEIGSYTGDVSISQFKSIGVNYAIIGHSERRKYYDDTKYLNSKLKLCMKEGITPIYCLGETKEEYELGKTLDVIKNDIDNAFKDIIPSNIIVAYEPIWAIGTGIIPSNHEIYNTIDYIKKYIYEKYQVKINVLYGGSVNNRNISDLETINNIDGYLVGGCSIKVLDFINLIKYINNN